MNHNRIFTYEAYKKLVELGAFTDEDGYAYEGWFDHISKEPVFFETPIPPSQIDRMNPERCSCVKWINR